MIKYDDGVTIEGSGEQIITEWVELSARIAQQLSTGLAIDISIISKNMGDMLNMAIVSLEEKK